MKTLIKTIAATALIATFSAPAFSAVQDVVEDNYARDKAETTAKSQGYRVNNYLILK